LKPSGVDVVAASLARFSLRAIGQRRAPSPRPDHLTAAVVAERTLNALGKGPIVVPGAVSKIGRFVLARLLSRRAAINIMAKNTGGLS